MQKSKNILEEYKNFKKFSEIENKQEYFKKMTFSALENEEENSENVYKKFAEVKTKEEFINIYNSTEKGSLDFEEFLDKTGEDMQNIFTSEEEFFKYIDMFELTSLLNYDNNIIFSKEDGENISKYFLGGKKASLDNVMVLKEIQTKSFFKEMKDFSSEELKGKYPLLFEKNIDILIKKYNISFQELENKKEISELNINENSKNTFYNLKDEIFYLSNSLKEKDFNELIELNNEEQIEFLIFNYIDVFVNILEFNADYINKNYKVILDVLKKNNIKNDKVSEKILENILEAQGGKEEEIFEYSMENGYKNFVINFISKLNEKSFNKILPKLFEFLKLDLGFLSAYIISTKSYFNYTVENLNLMKKEFGFNYIFINLLDVKYDGGSTIDFVKENFDDILIGNKEVIIQYLKSLNNNLYLSIAQKVIYSNDFILKEILIKELYKIPEKSLLEDSYLELLKGIDFYKDESSGFDLDIYKEKFLIPDYKSFNLKLKKIKKYGKKDIFGFIKKEEYFSIELEKIEKIVGKAMGRFLINNFHKHKNKKEFIEEVSKYIDSKKQKLSHNESIENDEEKYGILNSDILKEVYPEGNYSSKNINDYEDKTEDLEKYNYDKNGYEIKVSGLLGYKLKKIKNSEEFEKLDENMMEFFEGEILKIKKLSEGKGENIVKFIKTEFEKNDLELKTKTLEGNILEYFKNRKKLGKTENNNFNENIEIMNLIISYQLLGKFESFLNGSNDKISEVKGEDSINAVKINALINEYGDNLKDTINLIEKNIQNNEDKTDFNILTEENGSIEESNEYLNLTNSKKLSKIITKFSKIPDERKNIKMIHKSLKTTFSSNLQKNELLKPKVENLVEKFNNLENFKNLYDESNKEKLIKIFKKNILEFLNKNNDVKLNLKEIQIIQENIYKKLKIESEKFEEIIVEEENGNLKLVKKYKKERNVKGYFSKTKENALARGVGGICIGTDVNMWKNKDYFEFVLFDEERNQNIGTVMLLNIEENGKKYLLFGPNPSEEFVGKVSAKKLYYKILDVVVEFGENNNFDGIILDKEYGKSTNRGGTFQTVLKNSVLKDDGKEKIINLDKKHILGGSYSYKDNLNYVWKK